MRARHSSKGLLLFASLLVVAFVPKRSACLAFGTIRPQHRTGTIHCATSNRMTRWAEVDHHVLWSSEVDDDFRPATNPPRPGDSSSPHPDEATPTTGREASPMRMIREWISESLSRVGKMPPIQVDDPNVLYYDVFLLINLTLSISFWVVHRLQYDYIWTAFSEGCLLSVLWIASGLYSGAFLYSAVDGHYGSTDERGGPKAAGLLGFQTYVNAINLRLLVALLVAVCEHRPVGSSPAEQLLPLEVGFGMVLMSVWRTVHSSFVPRL